MSESSLAAAPGNSPLVEDWPVEKIALFFVIGLIIYCLSQWLAFATRIQPQNVAIFWPPAGVMLAMLVAAPRRYAWPMALGLAAATMLCNRIMGRDLGFNVLLTLSDITTGVLGALLYRRWISPASFVADINTFSLFLVIAAISALVSATLGSLIIQSTFSISPTQVWDHWFGAMVLGIMMGAPLLIMATQPFAVRLLVRPDKELFSIVAIATLLLVAMNIETPLALPWYAGGILVMPLLLWTAVRRSPLETSLLLSAMASIWIVTQNSEAFSAGNEDWSPHSHVADWVIVILVIQSGVVLMLTAIRSEQVTLEVEKTEQAARMRSIVDAANDGVIAIDERGIVETFSKSAEKLFGYSFGDVIGKNVKMLMPNPYHDNHDAYIKRYLGTGERRIIGIGRLVTGLRKDGTTFPMELSVGEARHGSHRVFTGFVRDVTERQETERRLNELQDELLHISRLGAMGELASALAHELNQPLTAIKNYTHAANLLLKSGKDAGELAGILEKTSEQAGRAGDVIKRLRSFVTARQVEKSPQKVSQLIEEACALALVGSRDDGVKSKVLHGKGLLELNVDRIQIQQILINLVRNAVEAVRNSAVREVTVKSERAGNAVIIQVIDTGPGLSEQVEANLFKPFVTTKPSGMGIGLSLSRSIAETHGGTLTYKRNPDGGAIFVLTLPVEPTGNA